MTDEEKFGFWLGHAQYDLETANESTARSILDKTKGAYQWLLTQKP